MQECGLRELPFTSPLAGEVVSHRRCDTGEGFLVILTPHPNPLPQGERERTTVVAA
jgi:hypothetical protein